MSNVEFVYIPDTRVPTDTPTYHFIEGMHAADRIYRTVCGSAINMSQYGITIPVSWADQFGEPCGTCQGLVAHQRGE